MDDMFLILAALFEDNGVGGCSDNGRDIWLSVFYYSCLKSHFISSILNIRV